MGAMWSLVSRRIRVGSGVFRRREANTRTFLSPASFFRRLHRLRRYEVVDFAHPVIDVKYARDRTAPKAFF